MSLEEFIKTKSPAELSKALKKQQKNSVRDKNLLLKKAEEIQKLATFFSVEITVAS